MKNNEHIQKLIQAATLYYQENMTQHEIAAKLRTTRQTVSKLLNEAKKEGIVQISINNPLLELSNLSKAIIKTYNIKNAIVIPGGFEDNSLNRDIIAQATSSYINKLMVKGFKKIGISWGKTVYTFIKHYTANKSASNIETFPLLGASNRAASYFMINEMVREFAYKNDAKPNFVYVPVNPGNIEEYNLFTRTEAYKEISSMWEEIDLAIVGIGSKPPDYYSKSEQYPGEQQQSQAIATKQVAGDICTHYFDSTGNLFILNDRQNLIRASIDNLKNAKRVVALAGGVYKAKAIKAALKTGLITDLITDEKTAKKIVE